MFIKTSEDWGTTPATIDNCFLLPINMMCKFYPYRYFNESGFVETTLKAIDGRTIHFFHTEGAGGALSDIIKAWQEKILFLLQQS